jgi:hypothetical protein
MRNQPPVVQDSKYLNAPEPEIHTRIALTRLRNVLRLNAAFSLTTGLVGTLAAGWVANLIGIDSVALVRLISVGLLSVAVSVGIIAGSRDRVVHRLGPVVSTGDLAWVIATVAVLVAGGLSTRGAVVMGLLGLATLDLGLVQLRHWRRLEAPLPTEIPAVEVISYEREVPGDSQVIWGLLTDHELYGRLAPNLSEARVISGAGLGMRRVCADTSGREWSETCTLYDPGHRLDMAVDTSDYPLPFQAVEGSWWTESNADGSNTVGMRFAIQPRAGMSGRLQLPLLQLASRPLMRRITNGWINAAAASSPTTVDA